MTTLDDQSLNQHQLSSGKLQESNDSSSQPQAIAPTSTRVGESTDKDMAMAVLRSSVDAWKSQPAGSVPVRNLVMKSGDEEHRKKAANQIGYCVDELCSCSQHRCEHTRPLTPFVGDTTYRTTYTPHDLSNISEEKRVGYGADGVPIGVDPKAWKEYVAKHGVPKPDQIPAHLFYRATPDSRDFTTEHRAEYTAKEGGITELGAAVGYGSDGVPIGVDPKAWQEYVAKHGIPAP